MIQEGQCWAVDDVRYLGNNGHAPAGTCVKVWKNANRPLARQRIPGLLQGADRGPVKQAHG